MFVIKMAASCCHLTEVFVKLRSVSLLFILPVCNFVLWLPVDGFVGMQHYETDFQTFGEKSSSPFGFINKPEPPEPIDPICQALIDNFTDSTVLYTRCIIENAKTYKRCQLCFDAHLNFETSHHLLRQEVCSLSMFLVKLSGE